MIRKAAMVGFVMLVGAATAQAQETGRYEIVILPETVDGEPGPQPIMLDTATGRVWYIEAEEGSKPRWRGLQYYSESQAKMSAPPPEEADTP